MGQDKVDISAEKSSTIEQKNKGYPRIYTKTGDNGISALYTGERRKKYDQIFEALGATDELSSHLGLARVFAIESNIAHPYVERILRVTCVLQDIGSCIATPISSTRTSHNKEIISLDSKHTLELEKWIDEYTKVLPPLDKFILPGGGKSSATLHVARAVCRRAERCIVALVDQGDVDRNVLIYLNRLSDFLFTVARYA